MAAFSRLLFDADMQIRRNSTTTMATVTATFAATSQFSFLLKKARLSGDPFKTTPLQTAVFGLNKMCITRFSHIHAVLWVLLIHHKSFTNDEDTFRHYNTHTNRELLFSFPFLPVVSDLRRPVNTHIHLFQFPQSSAAEILACLPLRAHKVVPHNAVRCSTNVLSCSSASASGVVPKHWYRDISYANAIITWCSDITHNT